MAAAQEQLAATYEPAARANIQHCLQQMEKGMRYECQQGFTNARGRRHTDFAEFLNAQLHELQALAGHADDPLSIACEDSRQMLRGYSLADPTERVSKLNFVSDTVNALRLGKVVVPGAPPASSDPVGRVGLRSYLRGDSGVRVVGALSSAAPAQDARVLFKRFSSTDESDGASFVGSPSHLKLSQRFDSADSMEAAGVGQGNDEWHAARSLRLTGSVISSAVGLMPSFGGENQRLRAWKQKLGLEPRFRGNAATRHGSVSEAVALDAYKALSGHAVQHVAFDVLGSRPGWPRIDWIGGSPDGIILADGRDGAPRAWGSLRGDGEGILEIKCPFSGKEQGPWQKPKDYYLPQLFTLMAIYDCSWSNLLCWTPGACAVWQVGYDERYFHELLVASSEFWGQHYLPAKRVLEQHGIVPASGGSDLTPEQQERGMILVQRYAPGLSPSNIRGLKQLHREVAERAWRTRLQQKL